MGLVGYHRSGRHKRVVKGINLLTLLWTDGDALWPCDYRLADPADKKVTKNDHFREMLTAAAARGFKPRMALFDSWYSGKDNLKAVRGHGWTFLTQLRSNRHVNLDRTGNRPVSEVPISASGTVVHLGDPEGTPRSGWSRCSRSPPRAGTRSTGPPTTSRWASSEIRG